LFLKNKFIYHFHAYFWIFILYTYAYLYIYTCIIVFFFFLHWFNILDIDHLLIGWLKGQSDQKFIFCIFTWVLFMIIIIFFSQVVKFSFHLNIQTSNESALQFYLHCIIVIYISIFIFDIDLYNDNHILYIKDIKMNLFYFSLAFENIPILCPL
jgi:hypothetical protein